MSDHAIFDHTLSDHSLSAFAPFVTATETGLRARYAALLGQARSCNERLHLFEEAPDRERIGRDLDELFRLWPNVEERPPLFGVPVGIKAIFQTCGHAIRCGSLFPPECFAGEEADLVGRLRTAGAVVFGMTATTEFAHAEPAATANPRNPQHTPGGSSSGSAAAVAAGLLPLALGTQTMGSVIRPAAYCGIIGLKPSRGRLSGAGIVPFSTTLDQPGFFCASLADAATVLAVLTEDAWMAGAQSTADGPAADRDLVLGIPDGPYLEQTAPAARAVFEDIVRQLAAVPGIRIVRVPCFADWDDILSRHNRLAAAEAWSVHKPWFASLSHLYRPRTLALLETGSAVPQEQLAADRSAVELFRERVQARMAAEGLDAWCAPSTQDEAPLGLGSTGSPCMNVPWTQAGLPTLNLPCGRGATQLPLGLQLAGRFGQDEALLQVARRLAQVLELWTPM